MATPRVTQPTFAPGHGSDPTVLLTWDQVIPRPGEASRAWLCTVRPAGRPHAMPVRGVWTPDRLCWDGNPETRHAPNFVWNRQPVVHREGGDQVVVIESLRSAVPRPEAALAAILARETTRKYEGYTGEPTTWNVGGSSVVTPHTVLAWTHFLENPTEFVFGEV